MMALGAMFTGVMCDTVVVETSMRYEKIDDKGHVRHCALPFALPLPFPLPFLDLLTAFFTAFP